MTSADFSAVLPELVIAVFAMMALLFGVYTGKDRTAPMLVWTTSALFVLVAVWIGHRRAGHHGGLRRHVRRRWLCALCQGRDPAVGGGRFC